MIEIYDSDNKNLDNNGDMILTPLLCQYKVINNSIFSLELIHPLDELKRYKFIKEFSVLKVPIPNNKIGFFKIIKITKNISSIQAFAIPLPFFTLSKTTLINTNIKDKSGQEALNTIVAGTDVEVETNIADITNCNFFKMNKLQAISGKEDNTFLKRWGGEIYPIENKIYIPYKLGGDYGARIEYGFNLEEINLNRDFTNVVTRIYPYVIKTTNDTLEIPEGFIDSPIIKNYSEIYEKYIDFSNEIQLKQSNDEDGLTEDEAIIKMRELTNALYSTGIDKPIVNGEVNFIDLATTEEYKNFKNLVDIGLGDYVIIKHTDINVESKERCNGFIFDCIEKKYVELTLGDLAVNEFDVQSDAVNRLDNILSSDGGVKSDMLSGVIDATKTKFKAMRDIAQPQQVRAMIFEDKIKGSSTYGALCLGSMGLEIASKRTIDDKDWDWNTFIGGGYVVADWLIGKLKTVLIENMDGSFSIDLNKSGGALFKNNGKKAMNIANNSINFYDWYDNEKSIGGLSSVTRAGDNTKALIQLNSSKQSAIAISAPDPKISNQFNSLIEFDQYDILNNHKPISIYTDTSFLYNSLFFGENDENQFYNSVSKYLVAKTKYGFGTVDKDSSNWTFKADGLNKKIGAWEWNTGNCYFLVSPNYFNLSNLLYTNSGTKNVATPNDFIVGGNFYVNGKKNRLVKTEHYGSITQNAYETCEAYFGDIGRAKLKNGKCIIRLDKKFLETVNTDVQYEVFLQAYGNANIWVDTNKMYKQYVVIEGTADIEFAYEIKAKQKDYENIRLEEYKKDGDK